MAITPATISLCDHLGSDVVLRVARAMSDSAVYQQPGFLDGPPTELDDWDPLFEDHGPRDLGWGYFCHDEDERQSRRLDMRGPTDLDPGPMPMCEPEGDDSFVILMFRR